MEENKKSDNEYEFIHEKIKSRPVNKGKLLKNGLKTIFSAVAFGLIACITFVLLSPVFQNIFEKDETPTESFSFPEETVEEEITPEEMLTDDEVMPEENPVEPQKLEEEEIQEILSEVSFSISDYQDLYKSLSQLAKETEKSMVRVTPVSPNTDIFLDSFENGSEIAGLIVALTDDSIFIIADNKGLTDADSVLVTFANDMQAESDYVGEDENTGIAILQISLDKLNEVTKSAIKVANLGSSQSTSIVGSPIIALGSPMGNYGSVCYGMVSSASASIFLSDNTYKKLVTDIYGSSEASGFLVNLNGEIIGVINTSVQNENTENLITAIGITELKKTIEVLVNKQKRAYFGITGADVPIEICNLYGAPYGAFVISVNLDSPAMEGGIQSGDIITNVGGVPINGMGEFSSALRGIDNPGEVSVRVYRMVQNIYTEMNLEIDVEIGD